jgi:hypothetical protein
MEPERPMFCRFARCNKNVDAAPFPLRARYFIFGEGAAFYFCEACASHLCFWLLTVGVVSFIVAARSSWAS